MKISDVMTNNVVSVTPDAPFKDVVQRMVDRDVSGLPVLDGSGNLVGIVTEADLVAKGAYGGRRHKAVAVLADALSAREHHWATKAVGSVAADVMSRKVVVCEPDDDVRSGARRMLQRGVKRMPVVADGKLVGIVSRHDLLETFARSDDAITHDVRTVVTTHPNRPDDCHVDFTVESGVVTLTGDVRYPWDESRVVALVLAVHGVIDVVSRLRSREADPRVARVWTFGVR